MSESNFELVIEKLTLALEDWAYMQKTTGDEGADWAERFERHFYEMIEALNTWYDSLDNKPSSFEELETMDQIEQLQGKLPGPLQLNLLTELEDMYDGIEKKSFD